MKNTTTIYLSKIIAMVLLIVTGQFVTGQTLYVPNGTSGISFSTNSNVGVGTNTPTTKLDIAQPGGSTGQNVSLRLRSGNTANYFGNNQILFSYDGGTNYSHVIRSRHNSGFEKGNALDFYVWKPGDAPGAVGSNFVMTMNAGNVGIGNNSPNYKLDLNGILNIKSTNYTSIQLAELAWSSSHGILFNAYKSENSVNGDLATTGNTKHVYDASSFNNRGAGAIMFYGGGGLMDFYISDVSPGKDVDVSWETPKMRIARNGRVGIGTTQLSAALTVAGDIHSQEVRVTVNAGADFVFDEGYELTELQKLEQFIKTNKHLPQIASEADMLKDGVEIGEFQIQLLQKVEELTLYVIELNKQNSDLKRRLEAIEDVD